MVRPNRSPSLIKRGRGFVTGYDIDRIVVGVDSVGHLDQLIAAAGVPRRDVPASLSCDDPDLLNPPFDRSFKRPGGYLIKHKLEAAKARAARGGDGG